MRMFGQEQRIEIAFFHRPGQFDGLDRFVSRENYDTAACHGQVSCCCLNSLCTDHVRPRQAGPLTTLEVGPEHGPGVGDRFDVTVVVEVQIRA